MCACSSSSSLMDIHCALRYGRKKCSVCFIYIDRLLLCMCSVHTGTQELSMCVVDFCFSIFLYADIHMHKLLNVQRYIPSRINFDWSS